MRRFHEDFSRPSPDTHFRLAKEDLGEENLDLKKVEEENFELKAKIKEFEDSAEKLEQKTAKLQIAYENSKVKSEDLKRQISDFREEVLKIKGEKRDMRKDFDAEKTKCEVLIDEINGLKKKCLILQDEFQSESKNLDVKKFELESLNTENEGLKQQIVKAQNDFEYINLETMKKLKIENIYEVCDASVPNNSELKEHTRRYHTHCKSTQFEKDLPFEAYPCFYCDEPLNSANEIISH